ncbi:WD repeat-containing protein 42A, partial [Paragonimus westermani]
MRLSSVLQKQIRTNLRVGGAYHIGTPKFPLGLMTTSPKTTDSSRWTTAHAFLRHPLNLVLAREQGDIGPCSKAKRLRYKASRWRVEGYAPRIDGLQFYGNRLKGVIHSDPQTFQESIQGSLWAVSRLHLENKFKCHRGCVNALCFNSTGNLIASGSDDLKVVVTNWVTKEQIAKYNTGHCMNIFHVKFIPDTNDTQLVSCACDSEVRLAQLAIDGSLAAPTRLLVAHTRACHKLALPPGEPNIVLSAGADGQVFSIDLRMPKANKILWLPFSEFFSIASNPVYGQEIALCGRSESIVRIYDRRKMDGRDPKSGYLHCLGADHLRSVGRSTPPPASRTENDSREPTTASTASTTSSDSDSDAAADGAENDSSAFLNSLSAQLGRRVRAVLHGLRGRAEVAFRFNNGRRQSANSHPSYNYESSKYSVTAAVYSNQGDVILASYNDDDIYLFDVRRPSSPYLHKYSGHRNMQTIVSATFFGPNSEYVVSGSDDGFFYVWDRESEGIVQWLHADADGAVNVIESHPTLPVLASAGLDYDFKIWSPLRPLCDDEDGSYGTHLKYTFSKVPPVIRQLRKSQLAKVLHSDVSHCQVPSNSFAQTTTARQKADSETNFDVDGDATSCSPNSSSALVDDVEMKTVDEFRVSSRKNMHSPIRTQQELFNQDAAACDAILSAVRKRRRRSSSPVSDSIEEIHFREEPIDRATTHSDGEGRGRRNRMKHRRRQSSVSQEQMIEETTSAKSNSGDAPVLIGPRLPSKADLHPADTCEEMQPVIPQTLLPFNRQDLELRVAQNWINRTSERSQLDGLEEADSRVLSAIESVAQLHARATHR